VNQKNSKSFVMFATLIVVTIVALFAIGMLIAVDVLGHDVVLRFSGGELARHVLLAMLLAAGGLAIQALFRN
jgi:hypothetical protein